MRAKIRNINHNHVIIVEPDGEVTEYWAPSNGGFVRTIDANHPGTLGQQVFDPWGRNGATLTWDGKNPLVGLIRAMRRRRAQLQRTASNAAHS